MCACVCAFVCVFLYAPEPSGSRLGTWYPLYPEMPQLCFPKAVYSDVFPSLLYNRPHPEINTDTILIYTIRSPAKHSGFVSCPLWKKNSGPGRNEGAWVPFSCHVLFVRCLSPGQLLWLFLSFVTLTFLESVILDLMFSHDWTWILHFRGGTAQGCRFSPSASASSEGTWEQDGSFSERVLFYKNNQVIN